MQVGENVNLPYIKKTIENCCRSKYGCEPCEGKACLIGFAKIVSTYAEEKKALAIPGGLKLIPKQDFKVYDTEEVAHALAVINLECKNCSDNHDDNCIINIMRSSLEIALMGENVEFTGSPLAYVMNLSKVNADLGNKVMDYYNELKNKK